MSCGVGCRHALDPVWLSLWQWPAAAAPIWPLAWELPYAGGTALKKQKTKKKIRYRKKKKRYIPQVSWDWGFPFSSSRSLKFCLLYLSCEIFSITLEGLYWMMWLLKLHFLNWFKVEIQILSIAIHQGKESHSCLLMVWYLAKFLSLQNGVKTLL